MSDHDDAHDHDDRVPHEPRHEVCEVCERDQDENARAGYFGMLTTADGATVCPLCHAACWCEGCHRYDPTTTECQLDESGVIVCRCDECVACVIVRRCGECVPVAS